MKHSENNSKSNKMFTYIKGGYKLQRKESQINNGLNQFFTNNGLKQCSHCYHHICVT